MKKLLSILLVMTMVITSLVGCGSKSSSYFDDVEKIVKDDQKAYELTVDVDEEDLNYFGDSADSIKALCESNIVSKADEDGNMYFAIKSSDDDKSDTSLEITIYNGYLYLDMDAVMDYMKATNPDSVKDTEEGFKQMGLEGKIKVNMKTLAQTLDFKWDEKKIKESKEKFNTLITDTVSALKKEYSDLQCEINEKSAIKIDEKNIGDAIDDTINFVKNDAKDLSKELSDIMSGIVGKDISKNITNSKDTDKNMKDKADSIKKQKDDTVKQFKDKQLSIVSTADTEEDEIKIGLKSEKEDVEAEMTIKKSDEDIDIKSKASKDSQDITETIVSLFGMFQNGFSSSN